MEWWGWEGGVGGGDGSMMCRQAKQEHGSRQSLRRVGRCPCQPKARRASRQPPEAETESIFRQIPDYGIKKKVDTAQSRPCNPSQSLTQKNGRLLIRHRLSAPHPPLLFPTMAPAHLGQAGALNGAVEALVLKGPEAAADAHQLAGRQRGRERQHRVVGRLPQVVRKGHQGGDRLVRYRRRRWATSGKCG